MVTCERPLARRSRERPDGDIIEGMGRRAHGAWGAGLGLLVACTPSPDAPSDGSSGIVESSGSVDDGADSTGSPPPSVCAEPTEVVGAPASIEEAVALINALPRPLSLDCFLERLRRPLPLNATFSTVSLQPAVGSASPRVFLFYGELIMSVAVAGDGRQLLEFGELVGPNRSLKGELEFPIEDTVTAQDSFERVLDTTGTKCRLCHFGEDPSPRYEMAFISDALRFRDVERVPLAELQAEYEACDPTQEPERCARLDALFAFGPVEDAEFPEALQTIYDYE